MGDAWGVFDTMINEIWLLDDPEYGLKKKLFHPPRLSSAGTTRMESHQFNSFMELHVLRDLLMLYADDRSTNHPSSASRASWLAVFSILVNYNHLRHNYLLMDLYALYNRFNLKGQLLSVGVLEMRDLKEEMLQELRCMVNHYGRYESMLYLEMIVFDHRSNTESLYGYALTNRDCQHLQSIYDTGHFTKKYRTEHSYIGSNGKPVHYQRLKIRESDVLGTGPQRYVH